MLSLNGCIVTVDVLNCQYEIACKIVETGSGDALALKGNEGTLQVAIGGLGISTA